MNILIDTGVIEGAILPDASIGRADIEYNITEPKVYPTDGDTLISIGPQQMAVVTAYFADWGDPKLAEVEVFKVLTTSGVPDSGSAGCCPSITSVPTIKLRSAKLCGWELKDCSPVLVITTPGKYELTPNAAGADVIVTAQILPLQEFNRGLDNSIK